MEKKKPQFKPISTVKAVVVYVLCFALIAGMLVGNYFADAYRELISVYLSGSGTVSSAESEALCKEIQQEGMVLLKNEGSLPLKAKAAISVFGQDSVDFVYGGAGSGSVDTSKAANLRQALEASGFAVNPTLWDFYSTGAGKSYRKTTPDETGRGDFAVNEVPASLYTEAVTSSFGQYGDAALVCIGRSGGESADIPTVPLASGSLYLQVDKDERDMLSMACASFDNVILLLNSNNPLELGFLNDPAYANVKSVLWCGGVGQTGIYAIGEALAGTVNPSGRLVDTYAYDSLSAPSAVNLGDYSIANSAVKNGEDYLVYGEGIYVGYRYYETRYEDVILKQGNAGDYDYASTVQFPFGYGLSYTSFAWSDYEVDEKDDFFEISVKVTNQGDTAGKEVVEIYMQSPYTDYDRRNGVEKAAVELVGFVKTKALAAGESETVKVTVPKELMKAYDASGAGTYIVDAGDYYFTAGHNAHDAVNNVLAAKGYTTDHGMDANGNADMVWKTTVEELDTTTYAVSTATGAAISNQFDDVDIRYYDGDYKYLSRSDWSGTWPTVYHDGSWNAPNALLKDLNWKRTAEVIGTGAEAAPVFGREGKLTVSDLAGTDYNDEKWMELVEQLTAEQAMRLVRLGGYATVQLDAIGLPATQDKDGPSGISGTLVGGQSATAYPVETVMACTWNTELIQRLGESVGNDSIATGVAGWYAPGVNIHRSPYSGRNFEYFSEDGFLSGKISAAEVKGTRSKGVLTYMKHFALNDQETNRYGAAFFANEQAIREVFLKGFEYTVTEGDSNGAMAAMNRLGATWAGSHKGLMTNVLRNEWGFEGCVITDQASVPAMFYQDIVSGLAAGTDLWLNTNKNYWKLDAYAEMDGKTTDWTTNPAVMANVQRAAKNVIYAVSTTNAMESAGQSKLPAAWEFALVVLDILVYGGCFFALLLTTIRLVKTQKAKPKKKTTEEEGDDIVKKPIVAILTVVALVLGLGAGALTMHFVGGGTELEIANIYVYGEVAGNSNNDNDFVEYELTLYTNGTYKLTTTTATCGYSMLLSNTATNAYGTYTLGASSDGSTPCNLSEATRIVYNGYSDVGGYNMSYDTDSITTYPIELPGGIMTEKADFWAQFGAARTVQLEDGAASRMTIDTGAPEAFPIGAKKSEPAEEPTEAPTEAETVPAEPAGVTIVSDDGNTELMICADGTYIFKFPSYNLEDAGTYTYDGSKLTLVNKNSAEASAEGDPMKLHYVASQSDQLTGDFTISLSDLTGGAPAEEAAPAEAAEPAGVTIVSDDGNTELMICADGTYIFKFPSYNLEDAGTYTYDGSKLTLVNKNGAEAVAEGDPMKLHYVASQSDQLTGDFTINLSDLMG